jgi:hypothetical protein
MSLEKKPGLDCFDLPQNLLALSCVAGRLWEGAVCSRSMSIVSDMQLVRWEGGLGFGAGRAVASVCLDSLVKDFF